MSFRDLLQQVKETTLEAYAHQDLPFERLVEELQPERDLSHSPLFQTLFVLQNMPAAPLVAGDVDVRPIPVDSGTAKVDLTLSFTETARRAARSDRIQHRPLRSAKRSSGWWGTWRRCWPGSGRRVETRVGAVPVLPAAERTQLVTTFNATAVTWPDAAAPSLDGWIAEQVARTPDAIAAARRDRRR